MSKMTNTTSGRVAEGVAMQVLKHLGMDSDDAVSLVRKPTGYWFNGTRMITMGDLKLALEGKRCDAADESECLKLEDWNLSTAPNVASCTPNGFVRRSGKGIDAQGRFTPEQDEMMHGQVEMLGSVLQVNKSDNQLYMKNGLVSMECGTGKTRAAATVAYYSPIDRGWPVVYITYSNESFLQICSDFVMCNIVNIAKIDSNGCCSLYDADAEGWTKLDAIDERPQMLLMTYTAANNLRNRYMNDMNSATKVQGKGKQRESVHKTGTSLPDLTCALLCLLRHGNNGLMILDEVHRCPASEWREILKFARVKVRLGMSATLLREDDGINMLQKVVGPVLLEYTRANVPIHYELVSVPTDTLQTCNRFKVWQLFKRLQELPPASRSMVFCDSTDQLLHYYTCLKALLTHEMPNKTSNNTSNEGTSNAHQNGGIGVQSNSTHTQWEVIGPIDNTSECELRDLAIRKMTDNQLQKSIVVFCCRIFDESVNLQSREQQDHIIYLFQIHLTSASRRQRLGRARRGNCGETHMCTIVDANKPEHTFAKQRIQSLQDRFIVHTTTTAVKRTAKDSIATMAIPKEILDQINTCLKSIKSNGVKERINDLRATPKAAFDSDEEEDSELLQAENSTDLLQNAMISHRAKTKDTTLHVVDEDYFPTDTTLHVVTEHEELDAHSDYTDDEEDNTFNPLMCVDTVAKAHTESRKMRRIAHT